MDYLTGVRYFGKCQAEVTPLVEIRRDGKASMGDEMPSSCYPVPEYLDIQP